MAGAKMHADEVDTSVALVSRLLASQFPQWSGLPITPVQSAGTDHALYKLGADRVVRLPRIPSASDQIDMEWTWLPHLAPHLPLAIPIPLAIGAPAEGYDWRWSVYQWLEGENATPERLPDIEAAAVSLAEFIVALHSVPTAGSPPPNDDLSDRGVPLAWRDAETRGAIAMLNGRVDGDAATRAWEAALRAPVSDGPPVWIHGDLQSGNLLAKDGRLCAVIDFGCMGLGDPACDLQVAWNLLDAPSRTTFRDVLAVDDATWERGRGWALSVGLIALPYYHRTNPVLAEISRRAISEVLADQTGYG